MNPALPEKNNIGRKDEGSKRVKKDEMGEKGRAG